jgi:hypothetical protein
MVIVGWPRPEVTKLQEAVLQFVVLEVARTETRPLFENDDGKAGLRQLARHDTACGARTDHDEIDNVAGLEAVARHGALTHRQSLAERLRVNSTCRSRNICSLDVAHSRNL